MSTKAEVRPGSVQRRSTLSEHPTSDTKVSEPPYTYASETVSNSEKYNWYQPSVSV